jgi:dipeptidyl aminopeptidase/acylaminoacyl peptidase
VQSVGEARAIPIELVLSGREITEPRLSPDGSKVAFVHRSGASAAISVVAADACAPEQLVTFGPEPAPGRGLGGGCHAWLPTSTGHVYSAIDGELWQVEGSMLRQLTTMERTCRAPVVGDRYVVYVVDEAEVWLTERATGRTQRLDDGRHEFCHDPAISPDGSVVSWLGWSPPHMPWDAAERVDADVADGRVVALRAWLPPAGAVQQPRFAPDGTPTCVHDGTGWMNVALGERPGGERPGGEHPAGADPIVTEPVEHGEPTWGMGQRSYDVDHDGTVVVVRNVAGFGSLRRLRRRPDNSWDSAGDLAAGFVGTFGQVSAAAGRVCALRSGPTTPPEVVVIDCTGEARVVATSGVVGWNDVQLPEPRAVTTTHDGVVLHARHHPAAEAHGRLLCFVHGGPTDQWSVSFRPRLAYWCSRGWDVLVVDPRGSTGHGREYQQALNGHWGRLDVDDTAALIRHAHAERLGHAVDDRRRRRVLGWAHGARGACESPRTRRRWRRFVPGQRYRSAGRGHPPLRGPLHRHPGGTDSITPVWRIALRELSPIHRAERIRGPLLVFHGTDDAVVPITQSQELVGRIREAGGSVEYVAYDGEGHGFGDPANVRDDYDRTQSFLDDVVAHAT